jgi:hypothetical protein
MVVFLFLWSIGIPALFLFLLCRSQEYLTYIPTFDNYDKHKVLRKADLQFDTAFIARGYRHEAFYWSVVKMIQKLVLVMLVVFFPGHVQLQVTCALLISFLFLIAQIKYQPMNDNILNSIETVGLCACCILFGFGLFFFVPECDANVSCKQSISLTIAITILVFICFCLWGFSTQFVMKQRQDTAEELRKSAIKAIRMHSTSFKSIAASRLLRESSISVSVSVNRTMSVNRSDIREREDGPTE